MDLLTLSIFLQQGIASGIVTGSVYALLAIAVVIIFKTTDAPNFAAGEMFMGCAYVAFYLIVFAAVPYGIAAALTFAVAFVAGAAFYRLVLAPIGVARGSVINVVIATLGLSFCLKGWCAGPASATCRARSRRPSAPARSRSATLC